MVVDRRITREDRTWIRKYTNVGELIKIFIFLSFLIMNPIAREFISNLIQIINQFDLHIIINLDKINAIIIPFLSWLKYPVLDEL